MDSSSRASTERPYPINGLLGLFLRVRWWGCRTHALTKWCRSSANASGPPAPDGHWIDPQASRAPKRFVRVTALAEFQYAPSAVSDVGVAVEDQRARVRLAGALAAEPHLRVQVGGSARALIAAGAANDLLVLHLQATDASELALVADVKREAPRLPIVAVCDSTDRRKARRVVDAGVDGLVFAGQVGSALAPTVAAVLAGQTAVPRALRATVQAPSLSFREKQILGMIVMGFTNAEIAARLVVAESTVKSHLTAAFRKLGVQSRSEAASLILDPNGSLGPGILAITGSD